MKRYNYKNLDNPHPSSKAMLNAIMPSVALYVMYCTEPHCHKYQNTEWPSICVTMSPTSGYGIQYCDTCSNDIQHNDTLLNVKSDIKHYHIQHNDYLQNHIHYNEAQNNDN